ncbi:MAG: NAD(P)/FAD-dependent oxidoreductase [Flavobacteriaceae bacterium]
MHDIAVIGGGAFGVMTAIALAESGYAATVYERLPELMAGTTRSGNRVHMGYHYPRDATTVRQCMRGYARFTEEFAEAILGNVTNAYFIADAGSLVSAEEYIAFCDRFSLPYSRIDPGGFAGGIHDVSLGILTPEVMFDPAAFRRIALKRLSESGAGVVVETDIADIRHEEDGGFLLQSASGRAYRADAVVNCAYANMGRVAAGFGAGENKRQFEYTAIPVVRVPGLPPCSVTVLDGSFFCLLPYGRAGDYLLYHVDHSVVARDRAATLDPAWLDAAASPAATADHAAVFRRTLEAASPFMPALRDAVLQDFVHGVRMVLPDEDATDARPSVVTLRAPGYAEVFSGKISHCTWVGEEVAALLAGEEA